MIRLAVVILFCSAASAAAQTPAPSPAPTDTDDGRYIFNKAQDGFLRLDTRTGQVALCGRRNVGWTCDAVPEERAALEHEIARLQADNTALKKELMSRGLALPGNVKPDQPPAAAPKREPDLRLPSNAEIERLMASLEQMWRRLVEAILNLQKDLMKKT